MDKLPTHQELKARLDELERHPELMEDNRRYNYNKTYPDAATARKDAEQKETRLVFRWLWLWLIIIALLLWYNSSPHPDRIIQDQDSGYYSKPD